MQPGGKRSYYEGIADMAMATYTGMTELMNCTLIELNDMRQGVIAVLERQKQKKIGK